MDSSILIGLVGSSITIIVVVGATAWHLANKISNQGSDLSDKISDQSEKIAGLEGEVSGMKNTYSAIYEGCSKMFRSQDRRVTRLEDQMLHGDTK